MARSLGFDNINMDLIVGLPGEDKEKVAHTLEKVEALNPVPDRPFPCVKACNETQPVQRQISGNLV